MTKVDRILALLESRILRGDYALRPIPAEVTLAAEVGVSRMTARKAILRLVERGLLFRAPNGRLHARPASIAAGLGRASDENVDRPHIRTARKGKGSRSASKLLISFAAPAYGSAAIDRWRIAVEQCVERIGGRVRITHFHHWDDPILLEISERFDGVFLVPPAEPVPPAIAQRLRAQRAPLVALDTDLSPLGIRSVDLTPPAAMQRLLDHLAGLGHRAIHCFNTQPVDLVVEQRIEQWHLWRSAQNISEGELINEPDQSYGDPVRRAYGAMADRLSAGPLNASAVVCVTMPAALGVMRAMYERGIAVGRDVSVCAANDEGIAAYLSPSLTCTRMPDPIPYLAVCLQWMAGEPVLAPLLSRPTEIPLFVGESTGPAPQSLG